MCGGGGGGVMRNVRIVLWAVGLANDGEGLLYLLIVYSFL